MRKLAWAALPFAAAMFLAEYLLPVKGLPYLSAAFLLVSPLALCRTGKSRKRLLLLCLSAALGFGWYFAFYQLRVDKCEALAGQEYTLEARVIGFPYVSEDYSRVDVRLTDPSLPRVNGSIYLYEGEMPPLEPGDRIRVCVKMAREPLRMADRNLYFRGYVQDESLQKTGRWPGWWLSFPLRLSQMLKSSCDRIFPDVAAPFIKAVMTGDTGDLKEDAGAYTDLRLAGAAHLVAVSGMHLSFLVGLIQILFGRGRKASLLGIPLIAVFIFLAGATPSVIRAGVLNILLLLAPLVDRERDSVTSLSAALALLLLVNPKAAGSVSLQLSFAAAAGMDLVYPLVDRWALRFAHNRLGAVVIGNLGASLGAGVFTVPLAACYFGVIPLLSPLTGLLTLFLVELIFCAGYILSLLGLFLPALAAFLGWIPAGAALLCRWIYGAAASLPSSCLYTDNRWVILWLFFVYGLFALCLFLRRKGRPLRPVLPAAVSITTLCLLMLGIDILGPRGSFVTALDVGQGSGTVLLCEDTAAVVDCGGNALDNAGDLTANYLLSRGQENVDLLVLTHLHKDHTNGVEQLLRRLPVSCIVLPEDSSDDDEMLAGILSAAEAGETEILWLREPCAMTLGEMELVFHLPQSGENENERGLVLWAELEDRKVLITGDMNMDGELALTASGYLDKTEVFIAGHHGSRYSSSHYLLRVIQPETAIISVGSNSYGHPHPDAIERLTAWSGELRRTDLEGNITVRINAYG